MKVERLQRHHFEALREQGCNIGGILTTPGYFEALTAQGFAGVVDAGVVACMGACEQNPGNWRCWAHTDPYLASKHFFALNKAMRGWLAEFRPPRLETVVLVGNLTGIRWARDLHGFQQEGVMQHAFEGRDAWLLSRVNR